MNNTVVIKNFPKTLCIQDFVCFPADLFVEKNEIIHVQFSFSCKCCFHPWHTVHNWVLKNILPFHITRALQVAYHRIRECSMSSSIRGPSFQESQEQFCRFLVHDSVDQQTFSLFPMYHPNISL